METGLVSLWLALIVVAFGVLICVAVLDSNWRQKIFYHFEIGPASKEFKTRNSRTPLSEIMTNKDNNSEVEEVIKVNKWDGSAVKHAIDDAVKKSLIGRPNHSEHFGLIDGRLFICALAVGVALFALGWDHKYPFPLSRPVLIACVGSYFVLMGVLTLYTAFCEKNTFAVAIQKNGSKNVTWKASSIMHKYDDQYTMLVSCKTSKSEREAQMTKSCANYMDSNGLVLENLVATDLSKLINMLNEK